MEIVYWVFFLFSLTYEPIFGYFGFESFKRKLHTDPLSRLKMYNQTMVGLWTPTIIILLLVAFTSLSLRDIGFSTISIHTDTLGKWFTFIMLGIGVAYVFILLFHFVAMRVSKPYKEKGISELKKQQDNPKYGAIYPVTKQEKKRWSLVSITAGVTEEIIYRGFLLLILPILFPSLSIWIVMLIAAILFGLAHTYQGFGGVIRTSIIGLIFCAIYIGIGTILPLIVFHALIDYIGKIDTDETTS